MYAWIWRHLPGGLRRKAAVAAGLILAVVLVLWYGVFPWLTPKMQFDRGVVDSPSPTRS